jgi:hypothetical protein
MVTAEGFSAAATDKGAPIVPKRSAASTSRKSNEKAGFFRVEPMRLSLSTASTDL